MVNIQKSKESKLPTVDFTNLGFGEIFTDHMFIADFDGEQWDEGSILPYQDLSFSPSLSALHYGQLIFEGFKMYRNSSDNIVAFRPQKNAKRFNRSARRMAMAEVPNELFFQGLNALMSVDSDWIPNQKGYSLYVRPFLIATDKTLRAKPSKTYRFILIASPVGPYYSEPLKVKIETSFTRAANGGIGNAKTAGNYAKSFLPTLLAQKEGFDQLLWTNGATHDHVEELGTSNFFIVRNGEVYTPKLDGNILEGITRSSIIQLCKDHGIVVHETILQQAEMVAWFGQDEISECFATGTAATVTPIKEITYHGQTYLPTDSTFELSQRLKQQLMDIILGDPSNDKHQWVWKPTVLEGHQV